ncbi:MAG: 16S rRNA (cytidine(1402)-2'-O)-methyltransferase [Acidobacteria bacterium]|nr:MAG: 16S rRNA (cytidine(1402)-2'-O)-methyltransferase [Acidobacteriota bacterium]
MSATHPSLYLVGTPIGNLEDISLRALRILKEVDLIACEDTRQTAKLLNHYGIGTRTISYHEHNELTRSAELIMHMEQGQSVALVTDAGMPAVSDPGFRLTSLAIRHKIPVVPIPGPSAFLSALVASGLPTDSFAFHGFLPVKVGQRRKVLEQIQHSPLTQIFYEAPHRLLETLEDITEVLGGCRHVVVAREVTKIYEEFVRATAAEALANFKQRDEVRGEITLLIGRAEEQHGVPAVTQKNARTRVRELMKSEEIDEKEAMKRVAKEMGISKSEVYRELQKDGKK